MTTVAFCPGEWEWWAYWQTVTGQVVMNVTFADSRGQH